VIAPDEIASAYLAACRLELRALKPGNVHDFAGGHGFEVDDFEASAEVSAGPLAAPGRSVGQRVRGAIEATIARVHWNTNLGIVLLCAPLAAAAERPGDAGVILAQVLRTLTVADTADVYAAIRLAAPSGLGRSAEHDIAEVPSVDLATAMAAAAGRDRIARAYGDDFADVREVGLPALAAARAHGLPEAWCATAVHLAFLSRFPDTHIERKNGADQAVRVRDMARRLTANLTLGPEAVAPLLAFDAELKRDGLNPGTSADFTVATLFADAVFPLLSGK
jgi:triphosphoribosyl-dephospho-CoA synthase